MKRFPVDPNYGKLLQGENISVSAVLQGAGLPQDLFARRDAALTSGEYLRFMQSIGQAVQGTDIPIRLATAEHIEAINPPIFAAYCSQDVRHCIRRLAQYKALAGALRFDVAEDAAGIAVTIQFEGDSTDLPELIVGVEMALLLHLLRKASGQHIIPQAVTVRHPFQNPAYENFFGCRAGAGEENCISFAANDADLPFLTSNDSLWSFLEPELRRRLSEMEVDDTMAARVRSALVELLPGGACGIEDVCHKLCLSKRTLQRKLAEEDTTFQQQLNHTRELLAKNYLKNTDLPSEDIAFLLGYQDVTSFFRAFALWTGQGVADYKQKERGQK